MKSNSLPKPYPTLTYFYFTKPKIDVSISGSKEDVEKLGFKIHGEKSKDSFMWTYENVDVETPHKAFKAHINGLGEDYVDIVFDDFTLGYVDADYFKVIEYGKEVEKQLKTQETEHKGNILKVFK